MNTYIYVLDRQRSGYIDEEDLQSYLEEFYPQVHPYNITLDHDKWAFQLDVLLSEHEQRVLATEVYERAQRRRR
ncbi:hypothetical protein HFD88_003064 [Aspergillus terreus]|jgi:5'(3')-deoxyribonucleotidase|nr:hypothetical protein HFD88_003064 [Aspergillus terreus]